MKNYTGEFRLCLERVYIDEDGDRGWDTVVEVTDHPQALVNGWLPALGARLGGTQDQVKVGGVAAPSDEPAPAEDKPKRTRRTKAEMDAERAAQQQPVAAPAPVAVPSEPAPQPTPIAAVAAPSTEAPPARYNPFA